MATVAPFPPVVGSLYALRRLAGPYPAGVASGLIALATKAGGWVTSVRRRAKQPICRPIFDTAQERATLPGAEAAGLALAPDAGAVASNPAASTTTATNDFPVRILILHQFRAERLGDRTGPTTRASQRF